MIEERQLRLEARAENDQIGIEGGSVLEDDPGAVEPLDARFSPATAVRNGPDEVGGLRPELLLQRSARRGEQLPDETDHLAPDLGLCALLVGQVASSSGRPQPPDA